MDPDSMRWIDPGTSIYQIRRIGKYVDAATDTNDLPPEI